MIVLGGIDIGGTKCAVVIGSLDERAGEPEAALLGKRRFPTPATPTQAIEALIQALNDLITESGTPSLAAIGISCGGPLDSARGLVLSPPNLPGWDHIDIVSPFREAFGVPVALQNDANACALAEWRWGAGRVCRNMIFLTFGTGMGAGLILDGRLYSGANDMAGEVGHIRLEATGPVGYGKAGSFEGFCSGGGIAQLARQFAEQSLSAGQPSGFCPRPEDLADISAEKVAEAARQGDPAALQIFEIVGMHLGAAWPCWSICSIPSGS